MAAVPLAVAARLAPAVAAAAARSPLRALSLPRLQSGPSRVLSGTPAAATLLGQQRTVRRGFAVRAAAVGVSLPSGELSYFDKEGNLQNITVEDLTKGKKVVLFAVPGAFTPTCSQKHVPGFIEKADELRAKGVDTIACVSVNDPFVMRAWGEQLGTGDKVLLLADGSGKFTSALGVTLDLTEKGLGLRSKRFALVAEDGVITTLNLEEGGGFTVSSAEDILKAL